jgi:phosphoribosyl-AMP cyclohydrolase / phosphoribosyl-ATP pyrophosphohydrolase
MLSNEQIQSIAWQKNDGLVPVIVQNVKTAQVLMLGYMNLAALQHSMTSKHVTFFSRSKQRLWTKGESSGHFLQLIDLHLDCDQDTLLALADPIGPTCHNGTDSCFGAGVAPKLATLGRLDALIAERFQQQPAGSYTTKLFQAGVRKIAQKVGEEGVETALAAVAQDDQELAGESADLLYHLLVLLRARNLPLEAVLDVLAARHQAQAQAPAPAPDS